MSGTWVYNWIERRMKWVERGKAYDSPQAVPQNQKRPYLDPGKPVIEKTKKP